MALHDTAKHLAHMLETVAKDLEKAMKGNSAAAQRVRVGSIKLEKVAKVFRKESIKGTKTLRKKAAKKATKKAAPKKKAAKKTVRKAAGKKTAHKAHRKVVRKSSKRRAARRR